MKEDVVCVEKKSKSAETPCPDEGLHHHICGKTAAVVKGEKDHRTEAVSVDH
jgi:hypothetical protein